MAKHVFIQACILAGMSFIIAPDMGRVFQMAALTLLLGIAVWGLFNN